MKKKVIMTICVEVEILDDQVDQTVKDYREIIDSNATIDDVFLQIALNHIKFGGFCEGVGDPGLNFTVETIIGDTSIVDEGVEIEA